MSKVCELYIFVSPEGIKSVRRKQRIKPTFHYADFHRNFPEGKVVDTNHESRGHKPSRHVEMFAAKSVTSPRQTRLCRSNGI